MDEEKRGLKCRFCRWHIALYVQEGNEIKDSWSTLKKHVVSRHPDEFYAIQQSLVNVRAKLRFLGGDEAVGRFPRKGLGEERICKVVASDHGPQELCFDVN